MQINKEIKLTYVPVTQSIMQLNNGFLLLCSDVSSLHVSPQIIYPSQSTTLPAPLQPFKTNLPLSKIQKLYIHTYLYI